jgi:hypothetical protein
VPINSVDELISPPYSLAAQANTVSAIFLPPHLGHAVLFQTQALHTDWILKT